ncbi:DUF2382 domain-containing protein [Oscillatoria salina]|uniref:DUF2382 domain-containing protein n=1 Tax=Oscillatoria salina TaxID=331517 RepID=UPI0013BA0B7D|nr:DUF2382 domain-containing protein [Oscillatoria salina]MBZ8181441.1 DUF2382 domain-containing protein [Oscillatoria salina IIICB1]NET88397.1 DUF2382 domain-containing protein [Kamptonema sp. SIO1D9]
MALAKVADYYPNYKREIFNGKDIKGFDVYAGTTNEKIGTVHDALVDETGRFRYFVIDTGFWIFGKKVLLPIGNSRIDYDRGNVYALSLTSKDQAEALPEYRDDMTVDFDYEERVRKAYRTPATTTATTTNYTHDNYTYDRDRELYDTNERDHGLLRLYEERLISDKDRYKAGEVAVGKKVETETAKASVPVESERVVVERRTPTEAGKKVAPGSVDFKEGEVARMEVYEEEAEIGKEAFVREEVNVRKEVDRDTVTAQEKLRREELDVDVEGNPTVRRER